MRAKNTITVELNQVDAAIAAVLLAEHAGREAIKALLADKDAEIGGTTNRGSRAIADSYIKVGSALSRAIVDEKTNCGLQSTMTVARSNAMMASAVRAAAEVVAAMGDES